MKRHILPILLIAFLFALITFLVYLPALQNGFVNWDDHILVYENPTLRSIDIPFIGWALTDVSTGLWHPMLWLSFALDYTAWGLNPFGYHLTNIIFHSINTFLVFILVTRLFLIGGYSLDKKTLIAVTVTALLFGIHPLHVESVAWVTERKDVLYSFFFLLSILSYLQYASVNLKKYYLISIIFFILSLMSKPMAVSLPAVLLILDFYPLRRLTWEGGLKKNRGVLVEKLPFLLLGILFAALTVWVHPGLESQGTYPLKGRIFVAANSFISYLVKMLLPFNLAPRYPKLPIAEILSFEYIRPFIGLTAIIIFCIWSSKISKVFSAICLYYTATLMPVLGQIGAQYGADRYSYLPSLGPFLLTGLGIAVISERCSKRQCLALIMSALFLISVLGIKTMKQIAVWHDSITLWSHEIKLFPDEPMSHYNLGVLYYDQRRFEEAKQEFSTTLKLRPNDSLAHNNLGNVYFSKGRLEEASWEYEKAVEINANDPRPYTNLGIVNSNMGNLDKAMRYYRMALKLDPDFTDAHYNLGRLYLMLGLKNQAISEFESVLKLKPDFLPARKAIDAM